MGYLFIGGTMDGQRKHLPEQWPICRIPVPNPLRSSVVEDIQDLSEAVAFTTEDYRATQYYFPSVGRFTAYVLSSIEPDDAIPAIKEHLEVERRAEQWARRFERIAA